MVAAPPDTAAAWLYIPPLCLPLYKFHIVISLIFTGPGTLPVAAALRSVDIF